MLNLTAFEKEDAKLLEDSYDAIMQKDSLTIIPNGKEKETIYQASINALTIPRNATLSFQNLFKINPPGKHFYIAQCMIDFGYPSSVKGMQTYNRIYYYQAVGIAQIKTDLGRTSLRPETFGDKFAGLFFGNDIDLSGTKQFNDKYYLVSDNKEAVLQAFNEKFVNTIARYDHIILLTKENYMYISFDAEMEPAQSNIIEEVFGSFPYLAR